MDRRDRNKVGQVIGARRSEPSDEAFVEVADVDEHCVGILQSIVEV